jgi:hypothetical protein
VSVADEVPADVRAFFEDAGETTAVLPDTPPSDAFVAERWSDLDPLADGRVVEWPWVREPSGLAAVWYDERAYRYHVAEPVLDDFEEYVREDLGAALRSSLTHETGDLSHVPETAASDTRNRYRMVRARSRELTASVADDGAGAPERVLLALDFDTGFSNDEFFVLSVRYGGDRTVSHFVAAEDGGTCPAP